MNNQNNDDSNREQGNLSKFFGEDSKVQFLNKGAVEELFAGLDVSQLPTQPADVPNDSENEDVHEFAEFEVDEPEVAEPVDMGDRILSSCDPALAQRNKRFVAEVDCKAEANEDGTYDIVWKADDIALNVTGVVVLDVFRGYTLTRIIKAYEHFNATTDDEMHHISLRALNEVQNELLQVYAGVKGSTDNRYKVNLHDAAGGLPYLGARKPKDDGYEFINVGGALRDVGLIVYVLMAKYIEETYVRKGMAAPDTFAVFNPTGDQTNSVLGMDRNGHIRASKWQSTLSRLRRF